MVVPSRWSDIHVHGDPSYKLGEGPFWQGTEFRQGGWWHPKAALAADFHANRYALAGAGRRATRSYRRRGPRLTSSPR